jgi:hypothetical protein
MFKFEPTIKKLEKDLIIKYSGKKFRLPKEIQAKVDRYWENLVKSGRKLRRGEGFHIVKVIENKKIIRVILSLSDYAHYVYSRHVGLPKEYAFKNIHTSCLIETSDDSLIFGVMGKDTAIPGNIQCVGGGLDYDDLKGKLFNLRHNIKKELQEEVNINVNDKKIVKSLKLEYIRCNEGMHSIAAIFILKLRISVQKFRKRYEKFETGLKRKNINPEFKKLIYLKKDNKSVEKFILQRKKVLLDHYLKDLLEIVTR